jgi:serine/threonine protein phosphatase 1
MHPDSISRRASEFELPISDFFERKHPARTPEGVRIYAIGDIHGCADSLDRLMAAIAKDEAQGRQGELVFLGDYVDRGPDSCGVLDRLLRIAMERPSTVFLKGNHEAVFLDFLARPDEAAHWLEWGGLETVESYGVEASESRPPAEVAAALAERIPPPHLEFLRRLETHRIFGDYLFVHAGLRPGVPLEAQTEQDMIWIRGEFHRAPAKLRPPQVVVHGHQPLSKPLDAGWRIDVDTGACFGGMLTAVALDGETRRFISV